MPASSPQIAALVGARLLELGQSIRAHRKALRISAIAAAEAAGISRVTLHRIENGEPSVTIGAYLNVMGALGLNFGIVKPDEQHEADRQGWIPSRIRLADYPQLKQLAWQVRGVDELTPQEALSIYERNWRHVDVNALDPNERQLIEALRLVFGGQRGEV